MNPPQNGMYPRLSYKTRRCLYGKLPITPLELIGLTLATYRLPTYLGRFVPLNWFRFTSDCLSQLLVET